MTAAPQHTAKIKTTLLVVECYIIVSRGISLVYVTGISNERLQQAGLSSGTERISLSLPLTLSFSSFPAFHDSAQKWQKLCTSCVLTEVLWGNKRIEGWRLFVFYTTFSSFTPKHTPEKLMYGLSFAEHTHVWRTVRWGDTHTDVSSREFRDARWRGGLKIVVYMYIILYNTYLKYVHIYYNNLYSLSVINYKYKHLKKKTAIYSIWSMCNTYKNKWLTYLENIINS